MKTIKPVAWAEHLDHNGTTECVGFNVGPIQKGVWQIPLYRHATVRVPWESNDIQFPRLLEEIVATQDLDLQALADSMNLSIEEVNSLFARARIVWERILHDNT